MNSRTTLCLVYAVIIAVMLGIQAYAAAICLAIFFHAFYTTDKD